MSSFFRPLVKSTTAARACARRQYAPIRAFHSPYVVLGQARKQQTQSNDLNPFATYEKQYDFSYEPLTASFGNRTYVVSQPDASASHYEVPSGAYPTSSPYINFAPVPAEATPPNLYAGGAQVSSTSSDLLAHEFTTSTRAVPHHYGGVGLSSAVRYKTAPGEMGEKGGSFGGLGLMDPEGVQPPQGDALAERNPQPDSGRVAEKYSKAGVRGAWKLRR